MLISELAYIRACELDSPNSPDFDTLVERIEDELWTERWNREMAYIEQDHCAHVSCALAHHYASLHDAHVQMIDIPF